MIDDFPLFVPFWRENQAMFSNNLYADIIVALPHYAALPREQLIGSIERKIELWHHLIQTGDISPILERTRALVQQRVGNNFPMLEMVQTGDYFGDHVLRMVDRYYADQQKRLPLAVLEQIENWTRQDRNVVLQAYSDELERIRQTLSSRVEHLEQQQTLIDTLSAPIVPLTVDTLMLPLVGAIDERRAAHIMEIALEQVVALQAERLIIDITGVSALDHQTAHYLSQMARAIRMVGAQTVLVGINAAIAQALVLEEIDLKDFMVYTNLRMAIQAAIVG